ncbi:uncharacterized protein LOC130052368 [Ostrea edulis]|uniref:uncharacterized protein LOC130052368 n=1 Tax=Ostrea edulis TaxID=37623 RepID=UPI0024AF2B04|nr:uncharacterized protein LOC130052368 [Ostrea edulis]
MSVNPSVLIVILGLMSSIDLVDGVACTAGQTSGATPTTNRYDTDSGRTIILNSADNDYQINCCGFVSSWEVYITTTDGTLYAQVWRLVNSNWTLIGQNTFEIDSSHFNSLYTGQVPASQQISVNAGDYIGFASSGTTIPSYRKTNSGTDTATENVIFSDSAATVVGNTSVFSAYATFNIEFNIRATLSPGKSPAFSSLPSTSSVNEETVVGTILITVIASDADPSDNLTYTLTSISPGSTSFNFDSASGNLTTLNTLTVGTAVFTFSVADLCGNTVTSTFTLTVTNQPPVFHNLPNTTEICEDIAVETELYVLTVTDPTVGDTVTCSLNSTTPTTNDLYLYYSVGRSTYTIYLRAQATLDYNTARDYLMNIDCTDTKDKVSRTFVVYVVKNEPPVMTNLPSSVSVSPTTITGTAIFTVSSTDKESAQLYYNMTCLPSSCPFKIFASGAILTETDVANVTEPGFDLYIYVYDGVNLVGPKVLTVQLIESESSSTSSSSTSDWLSTDAKYILVILTIFAGLATFVVIGFCILMIKHLCCSKGKTITKTKRFLRCISNAKMITKNKRFL